MTKTQLSRSQAPADGGGRWAGWVVFASIMFCIVGAINVVQGLTALTNETYFLVRNGDHLLLTDFTVWGVVLLVCAVAQLAAGFGLNSGHGWARSLAVVVASVSILVQILFMTAYPVWSLAVIAIDLVVIYALTARWAEARAGL